VISGLAACASGVGVLTEIVTALGNIELRCDPYFAFRRLEMYK
jgi:hypothetical protein